MPTQTRKTYLPHEMAAAIRRIARGNGSGSGGGTDLDSLSFGDMSAYELSAVATNPGATDPKWYEAIAEAINTVKERGGSGYIYTDADEGKVVHNGKLVSLEAYLAETSGS